MMLTQKQVENARRDPWVPKLRESLDGIYTPEEFGMWLALPNSQFDGKSGLEMIHDGRGEEVLHAANRLRDGVYI